jgi:uncharacterized protein YcbK (DUF882 family)
VPSPLLSPHFTVREFESHDGAGLPWRMRRQYKRLCRDFLEPLRREYGPVVVISGFRSDDHNASVGGAPLSFHRSILGRRGVAADVACRDGTAHDWRRFLERLGPGGLGVYEGHVHVDTRRGTARW